MATRRTLSRAACMLYQNQLTWHVGGACTSSVVLPALCWQQRSGVSQQQASRLFSSEGTSTSGGGVALQGFLDGLTAVKLRQDLAVESEQRPYMSYAELLRQIKASGAAASDAGAEDVARVLCKAGVVLHFNGTVYLRPMDIAEMVARTLPSDPTSAEGRLAEVDRELEQMDQQHRGITRAAQRWPKFWLYTGCIAVAAQFVIMAYLTWWELSWDVMEPIAYHLSLGYAVVAYMYWLATRNSLDYGPFEEYWQDRLLRKRLTQHGFDVERYRHLRHLKDNYSRYLAAQREQAAGAAGSDSKDKSG